MAVLVVRPSIPPHRHLGQTLRLDEELVVGRALGHAFAADEGEDRDELRIDR